MLDTGIGETGVNTFLSALNVPTVHPTSLKRWERHVGLQLEKLADELCSEAIVEEKKLTMDAKRYKV